MPVTCVLRHPYLFRCASHLACFVLYPFFQLKKAFLGPKRFSKWSCLPRFLRSRSKNYLYIDVVMNLYSSLSQMLVRLKDPVPVNKHKELCTPFLLWSARTCTSARLGGASSSVSVNTTVHWRMETSKHLPWQSMCSRLDMQCTSASLRCWTITSTPPHAACWKAGTSSTTRQSWTGSEESYWKCTRRS